MSSQDKHNQQITVIGLGSMGWGAAVSLLKAGFSVNGVDVREDVLVRFRAKGGTPFSTPAVASAGSDIILIFVVNDEQTEEVLFGQEGAVSSAQQDTVFINCATMAPSSAVSIGSKLESAGMKVIDAPVSGGAAKAELGQMTVMASGDSDAFRIAQPVFDAISTKVFPLGDDVGQGSRVKMINQLLAGVHIAATAEAMTLAAKVGLDLSTVYEVIRECAGSSWMFENRGVHIIEGDYSPKSAVDIFVKDLGIVSSEAKSVGSVTPLAQQALSLFTTAVEEGLGKEDDAAVAKVLAKQSNVELPGV